MLSRNFLQSSCLISLSAVITSTCHHPWFKPQFVSFFWFFVLMSFMRTGFHCETLAGLELKSSTCLCLLSTAGIKGVHDYHHLKPEFFIYSTTSERCCLVLSGPIHTHMHLQRSVPTQCKHIHTQKINRALTMALWINLASSLDNLGLTSKIYMMKRTTRCPLLTIEKYIFFKKMILVN